jgi:hypothetical protein
MGGTCCKATFDPKRVHIKKINEIFLNCKSAYPVYSLSLLPIYTMDWAEW